MNQDLSKAAVAEFIGTFMLVFVGAGAVMLTAGSSSGLLVAALAHGLILVAIIATYGHVSSAHVNPAVSLATWISGHLSTQKLAYYLLAQFLGGMLAAAVLWAVVPEESAGRAVMGQTLAAPGMNTFSIIVLEALMTFFLVSTIYQTAIYGKAGSLAPLYIGLTLAGAILLGGTLTGASLNPARTLGPWLVAEERASFGELLTYFAGIFGGGALAAFVHMETFEPEDGDGNPAPSVRRLRRRKSSGS